MGFWDWIWLMFWAFAYIAFLFALVAILMDLFSDPKIGGWGKAGWVILLVFLPFLGGLIYLIARGSGMAARRGAGRERPREDDDYKPKPFADPGAEITKAKELLDQGIISAGEYEAIKAKALGSTI